MVQEQVTWSERHRIPIRVIRDFKFYDCDVMFKFMSQPAKKVNAALKLGYSYQWGRPLRRKNEAQLP